jgi:hypothetical protein
MALRVRDQASVIIEEGEEENLALLIGVGRVGELGAVHSVALPEITEVAALETAIGLGTLLGEELGGGGASLSQLAAQGARGKRFLGNGLSFVQEQHLGNRAGRA